MSYSFWKLPHDCKNMLAPNNKWFESLEEHWTIRTAMESLTVEENH